MPKRSSPKSPRPLPRKLSIHDIDGPTLRIPRDIPKSQACDEYLGNMTYSTFIRRKNNKGYLTLKTDLNVVIMEGNSVILVKDAKGVRRKVGANGCAIGLVPGTHEILTLNFHQLRTSWWMWIFSDQDAQEWGRLGYICSPNLLGGPRPKGASFIFRHSVHGASSAVPGTFATQYLLAGIFPLVHPGFHDFLRAGPFREDSSLVMRFDMSARHKLPHLDILEKKKRRNMDDQRHALCGIHKYEPAKPDPSDPWS